MGIEAVLARGALVLIALAGAYLAALWFVMVVWTFRDSEARSKSIVTQIFSTLLVVLFFAPGLLLYIILRPKATLDEVYQRSLEEEYLLQDLEALSLCPGCQRAVEDEFVLCPHCHTTLRGDCANCGRLVDVRWELCPYCGVTQDGAAAATVRERVEAPAARWLAPGLLRRRSAVAPADPAPALSPVPEPARPAALANGTVPAITPAETTPAVAAVSPVAVPDQEQTPSVPAADTEGVARLPRIRAGITNGRGNGSGHRNGHGPGNGTGPVPASPPPGARHDLERLETLARMATGEYRRLNGEGEPEALPAPAAGSAKERGAGE